jgi:hypothetical protein
LVIVDPSALDQFSKVSDVLKGTKSEIAPFTTQLPTTLHAGFSATLSRINAMSWIPGELTIAGDYSQGLVDASAMIEKPRFSMGLEYRPWHWLPLRTGVSFGGFAGFSLALGGGFNLGAFDLDFATEDVNWLFGSGSTSSGSISLGMKFRFLD